MKEFGAFPFFALLSRMKFISRWALMRNAQPETLSEHSLETAVLAHCLATIRNVRFGGGVSPERAALLALFHDAPEVLTGDLPTPVKYHSEQLRSAYRQVEESAADLLLALLPEDFRAHYAPLLSPAREDRALWCLVKAADKLSALIKCIEEQKAGNREFCKAQESTHAALLAMELPEVLVFLDEFLPAFEEPLDGLLDIRQ
ncbi:MAG: 5'-deoxynucleotidase [Oscillospiraceae bacterium]|jgi:5'-deoxynucleotidase|nr:5'-deoxynucleotidase [Oscillospiraceae bacterium]